VHIRFEGFGNRLISLIAVLPLVLIVLVVPVVVVVDQKQRGVVMTFHSVLKVDMPKRLVGMTVVD